MEVPSFSVSLNSEKNQAKGKEDPEKPNKKRRFVEFDEEKINSLVDEAQAKKTKESTKWAVTVFKEWCTERRIQDTLEEMTTEKLDENLRKFYAEARSRNGENYSRATLLALRNGIERYLNSPPNNKGIKLTNDATFILSNKVLDAKIKQLKRDNEQSTTHKAAIELEDLKKLKSSDVLLSNTPLSLMRNAWFHTTLYWCRRGREGQRNLTKHSFVFCTDGTGAKYVTMAHDESTKNHPGGIQDQESFEKSGRMYKTDSPTDGYTSLLKYLEKLNQNCEALFQYPKRKWAGDADWYENRPLGVNKLSTMMKDISVAAKLSKIYTNHCVRATAITIWSQAGLANRQIMAISGHRNEASLRSYNNQPSSSQLRQCSNVLAQALGDENSHPSDQQLPSFPNQAVSSQTLPTVRPPLNVVQASSQSKAFTMFDNCNVGNVYITYQS